MEVHSGRERLAGLLVVLALHAVVLHGLWKHRLLSLPAGAATVFVDFIAPPVPLLAEQPKPLPARKPHSIDKPRSRQLLAETPPATATDFVVPPPVAEAVIEAPAIPQQPAPVALAVQLAVVCPQRTAPEYPAGSRRRGEAGTVVLRVELDEQGLVSSARVETGSGFERLDQAALAAVSTWRCQPSRRDGMAVRSVALQPFKFLLQGN